VSAETVPPEGALEDEQSIRNADRSVMGVACATPGKPNRQHRCRYR
jgi:hypothetical protein